LLVDQGQNNSLRDLETGPQKVNGPPNQHVVPVEQPSVTAKADQPSHFQSLKSASAPRLTAVDPLCLGARPGLPILFR
ncbi:MAG: hypothetical protein VXY89_15765, partial [SAR324 cluster bacterium]|nr:hypothetical protein [SAR324 cluster bacterium]